MLQHGQLVHEKYKLLMWLMSTLEADDIEYAQLLRIYKKVQHQLPPVEVLERYHVYHDCGKHLALTIDEDGKRRYPDHASISSRQYLHLFPEETLTAHLIERDMDFHTLRGDDLIKLCRSPFAPILYFTAWAEIEANAEMFGGKESESYKIKRSRLLQAGKKLLNS